MMSSHVAILGPGLLGGSLAMALRERSLARVSVWARRLAAVEEVRAKGCCDEASSDAAGMVEKADVVVFATPIGDARLGTRNRSSSKTRRPGHGCRKREGWNLRDPRGDFRRLAG